MDKLHDREYWDLQETANYLAIDKSLVLEHLAREALIKYKGQAISNEYLNAEGDFDDVALIRWIDGFFWLPVDIYVELEDLLLGDLESLSFQSLMPQFIEITIKDGEKIAFDGDFRCKPALEDWTAIRRFSPYDIVIDKNTIIYFWSDTVKDFAENNGFNAPLADNMLPTDVVLKEFATVPVPIVEVLNTPNPPTESKITNTLKVEWKKALVELWPRIRASTVKYPSAEYTLNWLKENDDTCTFTRNGEKTEFCWRSPSCKEVKTRAFATFENAFVLLKKQGYLPDEITPTVT